MYFVHSTHATTGEPLRVTSNLFPAANPLAGCEMRVVTLQLRYAVGPNARIFQTDGKRNALAIIELVLVLSGVCVRRPQREPDIHRLGLPHAKRDKCPAPAGRIETNETFEPSNSHTVGGRRLECIYIRSMPSVSSSCRFEMRTRLNRYEGRQWLIFDGTRICQKVRGGMNSLIQLRAILEPF